MKRKIMITLIIAIITIASLSAIKLMAQGVPMCNGVPEPYLTGNECGNPTGPCVSSPPLQDCNNTNGRFFVYCCQIINGNCYSVVGQYRCCGNPKKWILECKGKFTGQLNCGNDGHCF